MHHPGTVQVRRDLRLVVADRGGGGLDLPRQHQAHAGALGDLDRQVLALVGADASQDQQIPLPAGAPADPQGVDIHGIVDHPTPGQLRRRHRLSVGDRNQSGVRAQGSVEVALRHSHGTVNRVDHRDLGGQPAQRGQHDPPRVIVDQGSRRAPAHPVERGPTVGQVEPPFVVQAQMATALTGGQGHRPGVGRSGRGQDVDSVPTAPEPPSKQAHHQLDAPVPIGRDRIPRRRDEYHLHLQPAPGMLCRPLRPVGTQPL